MDQFKVLKQAWNITWRYRALWVFGLILALTTVSWETALLVRSDDQAQQDSPGITIHFDELGRPIVDTEEFEESMEELAADLGRFFDDMDEDEIVNMLITTAIVFVSVGFLLFILSKIARYVSETSLIRMVGEHETTGTMPSVRQGFRLGWSRSAWRFFLIDLLIDLPVALLFVLSFGLVLSPLLLWTLGLAAGIFGSVSMIGLFYLWVVAAIAAIAAVSLLKRFSRQACALEGLGAVAAVRRGYAIVRQNLTHIGLMWLLLAGVRFAWLIVLLLAGFLLVGVSVLLGGAAAWAVYGLANAFMGELAAWILAGVVSIPIFFLLLVAPMAFLSGLREILLSSSWTLTYRELLVLEALEPEAEPGPEPGMTESA